MKSNKKGLIGTIVWAVVTVILAIVLTVVTVLEYGLLEPIFTTVLGGPMPIQGDNALDIYKSDYSSKAEGVEAGNELNVRIAEEGFILLLNENNALPIDTSTKKAKVSVFGHNSVDLVLGGSGSGGLSGVKAATIYEGLEEGNFEYNPVLRDFYESGAAGDKRSSNPALADSSAAAPTLDIGETPVSNYTSEVKSSFKDYNDAAIVVISRIGGESFDVPRSQNVQNGGIEGNHYLQLDKNEYDMLDMVTSRFDKVIVVLNTLTSFQCDFIEQYNNTDEKRIDAVLWIGGPGATGIKAIGSILNGTVNPSGRTVDIYSKNFASDPTWVNFGDGSQTLTDADVDHAENTAFLQSGSVIPGYNMVSYEEGVYVGYRYYETRGYEESLSGNDGWYLRNVVFPFGYGLSYTEFSQSMTVSGSLEADDKVLVEVTVKNIGDVAGKEVVQLYVNKPYTYGGIEKPYVVLIDFAKTKLLEPGGTDVISFTVDPYDLASYDYNDANGNSFKGYELESGDYKFIIAKNSHVEGANNTFESQVVNLAENRLWEYDPDNYDEDKAKVENLYTDVGYDSLDYKLSDVTADGHKRKGMSRTDFEGTFPTAPTKDEREVNLEPMSGWDGKTFNELEKIQNREHNNPEVALIDEMPLTGQQVNYTLRDLVDLETGEVDYDNEKWEELLNSITFEEMCELVNNGAFQTVAIESIGKNLTNDSDGPVGFVNFMPGKDKWYEDNTTFVCQIVIGSTWNKDLAYQMGKIVGDNGLWGAIKGNNIPYSGWYAPAVNLHRSPFGGRNFEYYSEDPVLSGKLAVNVINGAASKGVYTDLKHFALNDQETNRAGVSTFCTEQAFRELYLKPFEIAVKGKDDPAMVETAKSDGITKFKGTKGIMSSFNRVGNTWAGGDYRLMTKILRNEWGFRGLVISDYKTDNSFMDSKQMLYAGNDLILASMTNLMWEDADKTSIQDVYVLRQATKNILYTVANSNSIQIDIVGYKMEWWKTVTIVVDCVVPVVLAVWGFFAIRKFVRNNKDDMTVELIDG